MGTVINNYNDTSLTDAQTQQNYIQSLQTLISAAQSALSDPNITRDQASAEREALNYASALLLIAQEEANPTASATTYILGPGDDVRYIAQEFLGDATRYKDILSLNGFVGPNIPVGTELLLPLS